MDYLRNKENVTIQNPGSNEGEANILCRITLTDSSRKL